MPSKSKSKKKGARPLGPEHTDSLRRDIEAGRPTGESAVVDDEDDEDIADQLLAVLDRRDAAAAGVSQAETKNEGKSMNHLAIPQQTHNDGSRRSSALSGESGASASSAASGSSHRKPGEVLKDLFSGGHHHSKSPPPMHDGIVVDEAGSDAARSGSGSSGAGLGAALGGSTSMKRGGSLSKSMSKLFSHSPNKDNGPSPLHAGSPADLDDTPAADDGSKKKIPRQKARKERKAAELAAQRQQAEEELRANGGKPDEAERERVQINELCRSLNVEMKEINPDGHCLYAAVADQLNRLGKVTREVDYHDTRRATSLFMRTHVDDFLPFISDSDEHMAGIENEQAGQLPTPSGESGVAEKQKQHFFKYCDAVENTGVWGGQPEILALSRAFETPIWVVQAGSPVMKVGEEEGAAAAKGSAKQEAVMISYHRKMYGLGEHYNSLVKLTAAPMSA